MRHGIIWAIAAGAGVAACFTPPEGVQPAEQALKAAELEGAAELLPEQHAEVRSSMLEAKRELARQDQESILTRSYRRANRLFAGVEKRSRALQEQTIERKRIRSMVQAEMQMLMVSVAKIESANPETDDLELWFALRVLNRAIERAGRQYRTGRFEAALETIRAAQRLADDVPGQLLLDEGV